MPLIDVKERKLPFTHLTCRAYFDISLRCLRPCQKWRYPMSLINAPAPAEWASLPLIVRRGLRLVGLHGPLASDWSPGRRRGDCDGPAAVPLLSRPLSAGSGAGRGVRRVRGVRPPPPPLPLPPG